MNTKQKIGYTLLGAVIMLTGMWLSPLISPPLTAQHNGVFGEIQCTSLTVVDNMGKTAVELDSDEEAGNRVIVNNKQGKGVVGLYNTEYGGRVDVYNNREKNRATMSVNEYGNGAVSTWDKNGYRQ